MVWVLVFLVIGVNFLFWGTVGLLRLADEVRPRRPGLPGTVEQGPALRLGVLMPAHDEELVIGASLAAITALVPRRDVHVVSDGSTDATVEIATAAGVNVLETPTNVGKAGALEHALHRGGLLEEYDAVMLLDADTELDPDFFTHALPMLDDPEVVAVAGCAHTRWHRSLDAVGSVLVAHRQRVYALTQWLLKYGQTWRGVSATHIVPGFASIYRTDALRQIDIAAPGLVIEDFNMTFEVQAKRLGKIAFHPGAVAYTQDPARYGDYVRQMQRWCLGLWQTVRRHRPRRLVFGLTLTALLTELVTSSLAFVLLPVVVALLTVHALLPEVAAVPGLGDLTMLIADGVSLPTLLLVVLLPDYVLTVAVAVAERRPRYLLEGLFFIPLRITDAAIALIALPRAWLARSTGRWTSPTRRALESTPSYTTRKDRA